MNKIKTLIAVTCAFILGFSINNFAISSNVQYKVAKVDVQKLIAASPQINALKKEQDKKAVEIQKWAANAQAQINKEKDKNKKAELIKKYDKQFKDKMKLNATATQKKLDAAEASINKTIETKATALGYNLVFAKGVVLYGADDITAELVKAIK